MMVSLTSRTKSYQHMYYFLYNDCLILFEDNRPNEAITPDHENGSELLRVIPLTHLHSYYIPENQGKWLVANNVSTNLYRNSTWYPGCFHPTKRKCAKFVYNSPSH